MRKTYSNMELTVEFLAGTGLEDAIIEAKDKARLLNVAYIKFSFNGVEFAVGGNADIKKTLDQYSDCKTKFICAP